jgi:chloride channel 7
VAAAFSAPIGGILFTLEEGASFWSTTLTFRAFFCAMVTELTVNLINSGFTLGVDTPQSMFDFGKFDAFRGYATFELVVFALIGCLGGVVGAFFNYINKRATVFRSKHVNTHIWKRLLELVLLTAGWATVSYVLPKMYSVCTPIPSPDAKMSAQQLSLLSKLQQFTCDKGFFNQLATLYLTDADTTMQQLFHFSEVDGTPYTSFEVGSLILFFLPYFFFAAATSGVLCPAGLFVPTLLAGATLGRLIGHLLNSASPGGVTDSGTYALIGAAAVLGGMSRMTIAGAVILLEATNKKEYLLPLMLTFAAARYSGNAINQPMYDMQIDLKNLPFLEGSLRTQGLLNYHPITAVMARPVLTINEVNRVGYVYQLLLTTSHNGFPVVNKEGRLRGLILRKTLCTILKLRAFSEASPAPGAAPGTVQLTTAATIFHDTIERNYPNYPSIEGVQVDKEDLNLWLDVRPYMDSAPYSLNESSSIQRCYRLFRSMGLRHLVVLDEQHRVTGMVTRKDISEHRLAREWAANVSVFLFLFFHFCLSLPLPLPSLTPSSPRPPCLRVHHHHMCSGRRNSKIPKRQPRGPCHRVGG